MASKFPAKKRFPYTTGNKVLDQTIRELIEMAGGSPDGDLLEEMMVTVLKMLKDGFDRGDVRLMTIALKELRYAFRVFYPYQHVRKVAVFGSARVPRESPDYQLASEFARKIVKHGWMVITGAASGIMHAGHEGAGRENSFGVNIQLPFEQEANEVIADDPKLINFKYFFTRKLIFMRESDATVLFPGGFGTHDEGFETLTLVQTGKSTPRPIVCIDPPKSKYWSSWRAYVVEHLSERGLIDKEDLDLLHFTHDAQQAAEYVAGYYRNYHSCRYIGDDFVIRIHHPLRRADLERMNKQFKDILLKGKIQQTSKPFEEEFNEPHTHGLTRLYFYFSRRHFARLHKMIEFINACGKK